MLRQVLGLTVRRFGRCRRGVAAVEFALVVPVFALLLFGIVTFGTAMNAMNAMQSGAQAAARSMAIGLSTGSGSSVTCGSGVSTTSGTAEYYACHSLPNWGSYSVTATQNCTTLDETVTVTATGSSVALLDVFGFMSGASLTARSVMRKEGPCS